MKKRTHAFNSLSSLRAIIRFILCSGYTQPVVLAGFPSFQTLAHSRGSEVPNSSMNDGVMHWTCLHSSFALTHCSLYISFSSSIERRTSATISALSSLSIVLALASDTNRLGSIVAFDHELKTLFVLQMVAGYSSRRNLLGLVQDEDARLTDVHLSELCF